MQFLIVLVAALACALAEPQFAYPGYKTVGYTGVVGHPGVVGYTGHTGVVGHPGLPAGVAPVAYSAPIAYSGEHVTYPLGYSGVYPYGAIKPTYEIKTRARREAAVYPLTTAYTHPIAYSATPYTYKAYSPIAYSPTGYNYGYTYPTVY